MDKIPMRPRKLKDYGLTEKEKDCVVWYVISGCMREDSYMCFVRPDLAISRPNLMKATNQFFAAPSVRDFMSDYMRTLEKFIEGNDYGHEDVEESREERLEKAVNKFTDKVMDAMTGDIDDVTKMDTVAKLADRVGILGKNEEIEEKPRRYLPVTCSRCSYREFVENGIDSGDIYNECDSCRTRRYAEEHGWEYDSKTNIIND